MFYSSVNPTPPQHPEAAMQSLLEDILIINNLALIAFWIVMMIVYYRREVAEAKRRGAQKPSLRDIFF
jgi:hypothetical protein